MFLSNFFSNSLFQTKGGVRTWAVETWLWTPTPPSRATITWTASQVGTHRKEVMKSKLKRRCSMTSLLVWCRFLLWPEAAWVQSSQQRAEQQMLRWLHVWGRWVCRALAKTWWSCTRSLATIRLWCMDSVQSNIYKLVYCFQAWSCSRWGTNIWKPADHPSGFC